MKKKLKLRNPVAKHSRNKSGAGAHKSKKDYSRKEKHKEVFVESVASKLDRLILLEKMQNNTNSASIWFQYEEEIQELRQELNQLALQTYGMDTSSADDFSFPKKDTESVSPTSEQMQPAPESNSPTEAVESNEPATYSEDDIPF